ncbi:MAG: hypothetical protein ABIE70_12520 [bacterium]
MEPILDFARGPLFRFCLAIMLLGLVRLFVLETVAAFLAYRRAGDKTLPWNYILRRTAQWLFPVKRVTHSRPLYSFLSISFHVGLLLVPVFLLAHVQLWQAGIGLRWPALPAAWADGLTLLTIVTGTALFVGRLSNATSRFISRKQDFLWPLVLIVPFITGYLCSNTTLSATNYQGLMLVHVLSAEVIFILLPFTKVAHCILVPFSTFVSNLAWKFPAETDDDVCTTLNKKGAPV